MSLVRGAIGRPVTVTMACVAATVVGIIGLNVIPLQLLPSGFQSRGMTLIFPYPNADPLSVERDVALPVEEALATVPWLGSVDVRCDADRARFNLEFAGTVDTSIAALEVRDRLERLRPELPVEAQQYFMFRHSADGFPDMAYGALVPIELGLDGFQVLEKRLIPKLSRIDGVASVDTWGGLVDQQAHIELDEEVVRAQKINIFELVARLRGENFNLPGGTIDDGGRQLFVRSAAPFDSIAAVEAYPVNRHLTLGDIGEGVLKAGYRDSVSRMNGQPIVWIVIKKESGRNTVDVCRRVREEADAIGDDPLLAGFELLPMWDAGESIEASLSGLKGSLLWGGFLAIGVLFLFLRQVRATSIIAAAIPFSFLVALALLAGFGFSLNILTLAGLTLAVGMLVDNAIVVVENVVRRREAGESMVEAAASGSGQVALAITLATLTTIVVFLPLLFVSDEPIVRVMITNLAVPISFGLLASLVTALLVVPLLASRLKTKVTADGVVTASSPTAAEDGWGPLPWIRRRQLAFIRWSLAHRVESVIILLALLGGGGKLLSSGVDKVGDDGGGMREQIRIGVELDSSTTLIEANDVFSYYEEFLIPRRAAYGAKHVQVRFGRSDGRIELRLLPPGERDGEEAIRERLKKDLPRLPGVKLNFRGGGGGGEEETEDEGGGEVTVSLSGPDSTELYALAKSLQERLIETGVFDEVNDGLEDAAREVRVELDREAVNRLGANPQTVLGTLAYQLRGSRLADLRIGGEDIPLIVSFTEPDDGEGLNWLRSTTITTEKGSMPLSALSRIRTARGPQSIHRRDRKTQVTVKGITAKKEDVELADRAVREVMATFPLPESYAAKVQGDLRTFEAQFAEILIVLGLGVAFMFLLMGVLFESFLLPVAVLPSLPFAFLGGYMGLWITGTPMDVLASMGSIVLAGIVVNNAIVLVDAINQNLAAGMRQTESILAGVRDRFRPVVLTASTTVVGLLPMAWSPATEGVLSYHSLARAIIGGLLVGTIGTLVAVPLAWLLLDDLRRMLMRIVGTYWRNEPTA